MDAHFRRLEINGGIVEPSWPKRLKLNPVSQGYADAQIDDYGGSKRRDYSWQPGTSMSLWARFSHPDGVLLGTAGFGFWNAPFGDPTVPWPTLPQATWFFYGSKPTDLPLPLEGSGRGWFVSTIDAKSVAALAIVPFAPIVLLLNNIPSIRSTIWPAVRRILGISYQQLQLSLTDWHSYRLDWEQGECHFWVDDQRIYQAPFSPSGPLGFVCWLDNQFLVATPTGRIRWGTLQLPHEQWLEIDRLKIWRF
jgi:hypothetical protein